MYFNSGIRLVDGNINSTSTCISIWAFDRLTAILIQQVHVFQFGHSTSRLQYQFNKYMYFNLSIRPVDCNINSASTCISIQAFDQSAAILIQQVHVFQFGI